MSEELLWDIKDGRWMLFKNKRAVMWMQYGFNGGSQCWKLVKLPVQMSEPMPEFDCIWEAQAMGKLIAAAQNP